MVVDFRVHIVIVNCLSNAMNGQNTNLPVCVCVSITLSVNLPTGLTTQRIFTVDSLNDADLRKDVPFRVSMMNNHIYGSKVPQNSHFGVGGLNRHFKPNNAKNSNSYIFRAVYQLT